MGTDDVKQKTSLFSVQGKNGFCSLQFSFTSYVSSTLSKCLFNAPFHCFERLLFSVTGRAGN